MISFFTGILEKKSLSENKFNVLNKKIKLENLFRPLQKLLSSDWYTGIVDFASKRLLLLNYFLMVVTITSDTLSFLLLSLNIRNKNLNVTELRTD